MDRKMLSRLAAVLTQTIWGFSFISSKIAFEYASPVILLAYRFTVAFVVMHLIRTAAGIRFDMKGKPVKELMILGILLQLVSCGGAQVAAQPAAAAPVVTYVLNTNTKKFHYPDCASVDEIKEKNRQDVSWDRDEVIAQGYVPCKRCNP